LRDPRDSESKAASILKRKYLESTRKLRSAQPVEYVSLYEAYKGKLEVKLAGGDTHRFDEHEVKSLLEVVPPYFWKLVKLPLLLRYERPREGPARYVVVGDVWQHRLAELMLRGDYSVDGVSEMSVTEFKKLVARYSSLIFVSIHL